MNAKAIGVLIFFVLVCPPWASATGTAPYFDILNAIIEGSPNDPVDEDAFVLTENPLDSPQQSVLNDFDGDGFSDLLTVDDTHGDVGVALLQGSTIQSHEEFLKFDPSEGWTLNASGDFNNDHKSDLLFFNTLTGQVTVVYVDGITLLDGVEIHTLDVAGGEIVRGVGDFNGDGQSEIIIINDITGDLSFLFLDGDTVSSIDPVGQIDTSWNLVNTGDFNGDGKSDLLLFKKATNEFSMVEMDGASILGASIVFTLGEGWFHVDTGNSDGDIFSDVLIQNLAGDVAVLLIEDASLKSAEILGTLVPGWFIINAGNYEGDARSDILIQDRASGDLVTVFFDAGVLSVNFITNLGTPPDTTIHSGKPSP